MTEELAVNGGPKIINYDFVRYNPIGEVEAQAAYDVVKSGVLSDFLGKWDPKFYGGPNVKGLECEWSGVFKVNDSIAFNSATSALSAAIGAADVGAGDEVIVSPYTMSASATSILSYNGIPVFADIDEQTYNMSFDAIKSKITKRTKAIMLPSIHGNPADLERISKLARDNNIVLIEDAAQAPLAMLNGKYVGTFGDIGVFSLNRHKHIHCGEGGMAVTNNEKMAEKLRMIRNHGEVTADMRQFDNLVNTMGFNFRMGEIEAAIARHQLKKLHELVEQRIETVNKLTNKLKEFSDFIDLPVTLPNAKHVYYLYPMKYRSDKHTPSRDQVADALTAEGVLIRKGFQKPLYLFPMYQKMVGYGETGCPFRCPLYDGQVSYEKGLCPNTEKIESEMMMAFHVGKYNLTDDDIEKIYLCFKKVFSSLDKIK